MCHPSLIEGMSLRCCQQVIVVISSLNAQMYDQIAKLNERGISACMIQRHRMAMVYSKGDDFIQLPFFNHEAL